MALLAQQPLCSRLTCSGSSSSSRPAAAAAAAAASAFPHQRSAGRRTQHPRRGASSSPSVPRRGLPAPAPQQRGAAVVRAEYAPTTTTSTTSSGCALALAWRLPGRDGNERMSRAPSALVAWLGRLPLPFPSYLTRARLPPSSPRVPPIQSSTSSWTPVLKLEELPKGAPSSRGASRVVLHSF